MENKTQELNENRGNPKWSIREQTEGNGNQLKQKVSKEAENANCGREKITQDFKKYVERKKRRREKQYSNTMNERRRCSDITNGRNFLERVLNVRNSVKWKHSTKIKNIS